MTSDEAGTIIDHIKGLDEEQIKDYYKQPFEKYAQIQKKYTNVGFGDMHHSADFVECAAFGPGSELLPPFIKNTFLHNMMLKAVGIRSEEHTSELQSRPHLVCRLLLEKKKQI